MMVVREREIGLSVPGRFFRQELQEVWRTSGVADVWRRLYGRCKLLRHIGCRAARWVHGVSGSKSLVGGIALVNGPHFSCLGESSL